jgi:hypothetical protein
MGLPHMALEYVAGFLKRSIKPLQIVAILHGRRDVAKILPERL